MNMMHIVTRAGLLACAMAATGCTILPLYQPVSTDAEVRIVGYGFPQICVDKVKHRVDLAGSGLNKTFKVPTNKRVTLSSVVMISAGNASHHCSPSLSFIPQTGEQYVMHTGLAARQQCFVELVQQDPDSVTGVVPVTTLNRPECG